MTQNYDEKKYMEMALEQAKLASKKGEVPIGAVIVRGGKIISKAYNMRERKQNALYHAEILAINKACRKLKSWRLDDCIMYVTLQPCPMCAGAILNARIKKLYIGSVATNNQQGVEEKKKIGGSDNLEIYKNNNLNWRTEVIMDLRSECSEILKHFFASKR